MRSRHVVRAPVRTRKFPNRIVKTVAPWFNRCIIKNGMLETHSMLALFVLLALSAGVFLLSRRTKLPYTVMLVLVGILIVPVVQIPGLNNVFGFLGDLTLTPELLFFIFLPALIFESAFNMNIRRMVDNAWSITLLSIAGLLISTSLIGLALYFTLPLLGLEIPFLVALLFGGIISSTDPVAVLSLFKEIGVPKRLSMIFEGESLFNDGTAVAIFLVILGIIEQGGLIEASTVFDGVLMFSGMITLGILVGIIVALVFSVVLRAVKSNEFVAATILLVSAHITFILCELINEESLLGPGVHISSIIATTFTALFLGNYSRHILNTRAESYLMKVTEHIAFMANSLVFLLAGLLFATADVDYRTMAVPILVTVAVVMIVRAITVFAITTPINWLKLEERIPLSWQILLSWGSLRGALAIIVLLVPADLTIPGWTLDYSIREFLLALTIGCILATLFIKAPLIPALVRKLKIDKPEPLAEAYEADFGIYYLLAGKQRFDQHKTRGFVQDAEYARLNKAINKKVEQAFDHRQDLINTHGVQLFERSLHLTALRIEAFVLKQLYANDEVSEGVYRRIVGKINLQQEKIEQANLDEIDPSKHTDRKDIFDRIVTFVTVPLLWFAKRQNPAERQLQYQRAQMILARKVVKQLRIMQQEHDTPVFLVEAYDSVIERYETYRRQSSAKVDSLLEKYEVDLAPYLAQLAERALDASGLRALGYLHNSGISSEEIEEDIRRHYSVVVHR